MKNGRGEDKYKTNTGTSNTTLTNWRICKGKEEEKEEVDGDGNF